MPKILTNSPFSEKVCQTPGLDDFTMTSVLPLPNLAVTMVMLPGVPLLLYFFSGGEQLNMILSVFNLMSSQIMLLEVLDLVSSRGERMDVQRYVLP